MENLTIKGVVFIDENKPAVRFMYVVQRLMAIDFEDIGYADYQLDKDSLRLSLFVDGPVSADTAAFAKQQLNHLRYFLAPGSQITIVRERWEMNVALSCSRCQPTPRAGRLITPRRPRLSIVH